MGRLIEEQWGNSTEVYEEPFPHQRLLVLGSYALINLIPIVVFWMYRSHHLIRIRQPQTTITFGLLGVVCGLWFLELRMVDSIFSCKALLAMCGMIGAGYWYIVVKMMSVYFYLFKKAALERNRRKVKTAKKASLEASADEKLFESLEDGSYLRRLRIATVLSVVVSLVFVFTAFPENDDLKNAPYQIKCNSVLFLVPLLICSLFLVYALPGISTMTRYLRSEMKQRKDTIRVRSQFVFASIYVGVCFIAIWIYWAIVIVRGDSIVLALSIMSLGTVGMNLGFVAVPLLYLRRELMRTRKRGPNKVAPGKSYRRNDKNSKLRSFLENRDNFEAFMLHLEREMNTDSCGFLREVEAFERQWQKREPKLSPTAQGSKAPSVQEQNSSNSSNPQQDHGQFATMEDHAKYMIHMFIDANAALEINISWKIKQNILNKAANDITVDLFSEAEEEIIRMMENDSLPRFLANSPANAALWEAHMDAMNDTDILLVHEHTMKYSINRKQ